jgi:hypothetical protein
MLQEVQLIGGNGTGLHDDLDMQHSNRCGRWSPRELHGSCIEMADGNCYDLQFHEGNSHGSGVLIASDGSSYGGQWVNGQMHGKGRCFWGNGTEYVGRHKEGKRQGRGLYTWPDGHTFEGEFKNNVIHGFGVQRCEDGKITHCGLWNDGEHVESRPVPVSKLSVKTFLSKTGEDLQLLYADLRRLCIA